MESSKHGLEAQSENARKKIQLETHNADLQGHGSQDAFGPLSPEEIAQFRKEALLRQMRHYQRENELLRKEFEQTKESHKSVNTAFAAMNHWWDQLMTLFPSNDSQDQGQIDNSWSHILSTLLFDESSGLSDLDKKNDDIKRRVQSWLVSAGPTSQNVDLQAHLATVTASLRQSQSDNESLRAKEVEMQKKLEDIKSKCNLAWKQLDRASCPSVTRAFGKTLGGDTTSETPEKATNGDDAATNVKMQSGSTDANGIDVQTEQQLKETIDRLQVELVEAQAICDQRDQQIKEQMDLVDSLRSKISEMTQKLADPSESDLASSGFVKALQAHVSDLSNQVSKLKNDNERLANEKSELKVNQEDFEAKVRRDFMNKTQSLQQQLVKAEQDVSRIRTARDDLLSELTIKKSAESERKRAFDEFNQLLALRESRISTLETEVSRLKEQIDKSGVDDNDADLGVAQSDVEGLVKLAQRLQKQNKSLLSELPSLEQAFMQAQKKATAKVQDSVELEARINKYKAEKVRADEKYFGAMRAKDQMAAENQSLKSQLAKSADLVQQLKDLEDTKVSQITNLSKQLDSIKRKLESSDNDVLMVRQQMKERTYQLDSMNHAMDKLRDELRAKDSAIRKEVDSRHGLEIQIEKLKRQVDTKRMITSTGSTEVDEQLDALRSIAICSLCSKNWKNTAIKTCGHVFCNDCATDRLNARLRKCPMCNKQFSFNDLLSVHL